MNIKDWRAQRIRHLGYYKYNELKIQENGYLYTNTRNSPIPEENGKSQKLPHILPIEKFGDDYKWKNIIPSCYQDNIINIIKTKKISLHKDFHHLTSSQALCFNLFFPLRIEMKHEYIDGDSKEAKYAFEYVKDTIEKTQLDHYLIYFKPEVKECGYEIKYTENIPDEDNKKESERNKDEYKFNKYKSKIHKYFCKNISKNEFIRYYQIYRHIIYSYENNILIKYVYPEKRPEWENIVEDKMCGIKEEFKAERKIQFITIEDIVNMCKKCDNEKIKRHYELFEEKYLV